MAIPTLPTFSAGEILTSDVMNDVSTLGNYQGLFHIKTQTVGNAVASVTVTSAFSSDFDSYRIIYSGGSGTAGEVKMSLGASTASYRSACIYATWAGGTGVFGLDNTASWAVGSCRTLGNSVCIDVHRPFLADETWFNGSYVGIATDSVSGSLNGYHSVASSYSSFIFSSSTGTLTGGTIRVYGYRNSL
jgi:hypothetical protein